MTKEKKSYSQMLKDELLEIARRLGLTNLSKLRKEEIVDLVEKAERTSAKAKASPTAKGSSQARAPSKPAAKKPATKPPMKPGPARPATKSKASGEQTPSSRGDLLGARIQAAAPATAGGVPELSPVSAQAGAQASKFAATAGYRPDELRGVDEKLPELPESYGDNRIVLLPRDLAWLFAYWDLTAEYKEAARAAGGSVLALRLYDVTGVDFDGTNAHAMHEHECAEWARSWYIPTPATDRDFIVEIGYRGGDQWFPLARSNKVAVPSDQPSTWIKDDFITIRFDEDLRKADVRERMQPGPPDRPALQPGAGATGPHTLFDDGELRIMVGGTFLPPSGVPSWPLFSAEVPTLPSSQALVGASLLGIPTSGAWSGAFVPGSGQAFVPGSGQAFVSGSIQFLPGSLFALPSSGAFLGPGMFQLPSSGGFMRRTGIEGGLAAAGRPDETVAEGGTAGAPPPAPPPPLLVASVEMVIAGRSLPGTELRIAGRPIPLGPDGAFSLRVTVPEGLRELPIEARAPGSPEARRIRLKLGRETD